ncbi:endonuclease III domain-containing protein [Adhaeribacter soli]|uniref:Fe-S cluster assembly protein HesB n=1 Tax=Adhaeribacter soli TaxID=2607655 RepID=A0A5N1J6M7_9BACT|nr:Fe-S cluster assembly protein HesB [Adhaeribacter soli]KAA9345612.1 Fe-S cluster assembly protein HesB [Adhaeribacter soli]
MAENSEQLQQKALLAHERFCGVYGCPVKFFHTLDPISELVSSLLSHRTKNADSSRAFRNLRQQFPTWEQVLQAPLAEVENAITAATWPEQKVPRLQAVLKEVLARNSGSFDLSFLQELTVPEAQSWLEQLPGVEPKTSAAVLLFSNLRMPAMPVDSHHHRVAQRLGLLPDKIGPGPAHAILQALLPTDWDVQQVYDHHEVFMFHGQRCCFFQNPDCHRCVVLDICPYGQQRMAKLKRL